MDPPCRDLDRWVAQSTRPSRYHGGIVRLSMDVKHRCDGHKTLHRAGSSKRFLSWGRPGMANAVANA